MTQEIRKAAMITGAASGIGRACALRFAAAGFDLVLTDLSADGLLTVAQECAASGAQIESLCADITAKDTAENCVAIALERFSRLDAAVNCAGIAGPHWPAAEFPEEDWLKVINVDLVAVWRCLKHQVLAMRTAGNGGTIVNIASTAGLKGYAANGAYCAAKHGVVGMSKSAAIDYAPEGIRINVICPGVVLTPLVESVVAEHPEKIAGIIASHPIRRAGQPSEIAETALWLSSDASSFVVGAALNVDGGHLAG